MTEGLSIKEQAEKVWEQALPTFEFGKPAIVKIKDPKSYISYDVIATVKAKDDQLDYIDSTKLGVKGGSAYRKGTGSNFFLKKIPLGVDLGEGKEREYLVHQQVDGQYGPGLRVYTIKVGCHSEECARLAAEALESGGLKEMFKTVFVDNVLSRLGLGVSVLPKPDRG